MDEVVVQTKFTEDGLKKARTDLTIRQLRRYDKARQEIEKYNNIRIVCPYCGYIATKNKFMTITKAQIVSKMYTCPRCEAKMYEKTLSIFNRGPSEYSKWVWSQFYEFDNRDRLQIGSIKTMIKDFGFDDVFLDTWKEYKEKFTSEFEDDE